MIITILLHKLKIKLLFVVHLIQKCKGEGGKEEESYTLPIVNSKAEPFNTWNISNKFSHMKFLLSLWNLFSLAFSH